MGAESKKLPLWESEAEKQIQGMLVMEKVKNFKNKSQGISSNNEHHRHI
jgi:hypothetical protein